MLTALKRPIDRVLFILNESKQAGKPKLTAKEISDYALQIYEEDLPERTIVNSINASPKGLIKKHDAEGADTNYEILRPGINLIIKDKTKREGSDILFERGIHPRIIEVSGSLFASKHYPQAILEAFKEVNNRVKHKSKLSDMDGKRLMSKTFGLESPRLKLSNLETQSDKDEQEGFMHIFMGSMLGIRNPKAHEIIVLKDPIKALEYLSLASLLLRRIDESEYVEST